MPNGIEKLGGGIEIYTSPAHPVTTDSILLSHFIQVKPGQRLCDFGTGCGIIPFMLFARQRELKITGVEIQESAVSLCRRSVLYNRLEESFTLLQCDLRDLKGLLPGNTFDTVCMNPPYKAAGQGLQSGDPRRRIARHEGTCTYRETAIAAARILKPMGRFYICNRAERLAEILLETEQAGLKPKRLRMVHQRIETPSKLFLLEARKGVRQGLRIDPPLVIRQDGGGYTKELLEIYRNYGGDGK